MIRLRLSSTSTDKGDLELKVIPGELLSSAVARTTETLRLSKDVSETFNVVVNGNLIEKDLWDFTKLREEDEILIAPKLKGGRDFNRAALALVLTAVAAATLTPMIATNLSLGAIGVGLTNAAFSVAAFYIASQLIPITTPDFNAGLNGLESSQMYTIGSQNNRVNKLGYVPKVYGRHKIFPNIAANPYTELETDPSTGELVQYFYGIYDFGLGPAYVDSLLIGDTPIEQYTDVQYNFVDLNKPTVDEGGWDEALQNSFTLYRGDVSPENISVSLNGNREAGDPATEWEVIRNAAENPEAYGQEITLTFVNPQGLYGFGSNGVQVPRTIDLEIEFSRASENVWRPWNDLTYVEYFSSAGGDQQFDQVGVELPPATDVSYTTLTGPTRRQSSFRLGSLYQYYWQKTIGYPKGSNSFYFKTGQASIGQNVVVNGKIYGPITKITAHSTPGFSRYQVATPFTEAITLFTLKTATTTGTVNPGIYPFIDGSVFNRLFKLVPQPLRARISRLDQQPVYSTFKFRPRITDQIKVRVRRVRTFSSENFQVADFLTFAQISTRFNTDPIVTNKRHVFLEVRIKATNQLNGAIQNLSGEVSSVLDVWNGSAWVKQESANPAWIYADLLTGEVNKRRVDKSRLHTASLVEWANFCDEVPPSPMSMTYSQPRFEANFILDFSTTLQNLINQVCGVGQASLNIIDGKYGVLIDKRKTTPVQIFTPRNSRGFASQRVYVDRPNALNIQFVDPASAWEIRSVTVYDNGFNAGNALEIEDIQTFAVTNIEQAFRYGRYLITQSRLRQETMTLTVDFENLVCTRGDYVQITQDVMRVGGTPARVKSVSGNRIVIDDAIDSGPGSYGYVYRAQDGTIRQNTLSIVSSDTFDLNGTPLPQVGDLIVIGVVGEIVFDCIVKAIEPNGDFTATLTLVERADAIFDSESTDVSPEYDSQISQTVNPEFAPPGEVVDLEVAANTYQCNGSAYQYYIDLDWETPPNTAVEAYEIYVDFGRGYDLVDVTRDSIYRFIVDERRLGLLHSFKVLAVSATGRKLSLGEVGSVTATPLLKTARPSNVESLSIDITNEVLQLVWPKVEECDVDEYLVRYSPSSSDIWESSIPLLRVNGNVTLASTQARTGIYFIKAVDFNGNESEEAASAITTIPDLVNLNVVEEVTDFPTVTGTVDKVVASTGQLVLLEKTGGSPSTTEYWEEGYYYYNDLLDLGDIYSVRLQSLIRAEGFTPDDLMSNWVTLDQVLSLTYAQFADWNVESEYRTTSELNVISNWNPMSDVDPISTNDRDIWTEWRKFIVGDATGRIFQFRLKLISNKANVTPRVFDGTIKADMPDRTVSFENQVVPDTGLQLVFDPAFYGPGTAPNVQVSIEDAQSGDYWSFGYKTLAGLEIFVFDKNDVAVSRTVDIQAKGYGRQSTTII